MEEPLRYHRTFGLDAEQLDELEARIEDILPDPWDKGTGITVAVSRSVTALQLNVVPDSRAWLHIVTPFRRPDSAGERCEAGGVVVPAGAGLVAPPPG